MSDIWASLCFSQGGLFAAEQKCDEKYKNKRVVMWDNTALALHRYTDALMQRLTFSSYYSANVGKGGVFVQLCGWLGTYELFPGAIRGRLYQADWSSENSRGIY